MIKQALTGTAKFAAGIAIGAIAGAGVSYLAAPRSGDDLRKQGHELIDAAKISGERARIDREGELRDKYRTQVGRRDALSMSADDAVLGAETHPPTVPFPS